MKKNKEFKNRRRHHSFTLIEIMIVVVIIGLLAALVAPSILGNLDKAKVKTTKAQLINLKNAVDLYYMDMSDLPSSLDDLMTNPGNDKWHGPYLESKNLPKDGWDNDFIYEVGEKDGRNYDIISYGADKAQGGTEYNADLSCWN